MKCSIVEINSFLRRCIVQSLQFIKLYFLPFRKNITEKRPVFYLASKIHIFTWHQMYLEAMSPFITYFYQRTWKKKRNLFWIQNMCRRTFCMVKYPTVFSAIWFLAKMCLLLLQKVHSVKKSDIYSREIDLQYVCLLMK